ncbi:MAG TPA: 3'-5' exonuclease [Bdellovibrionales bacterium]|nr:3'-5' exonuclease [Bdellovibrionales bacterium]
MRFIAFDLETTGFLPGVDNIVEIGAVRFVNGQPDSLFATLINPKRSMPEAASRVNGITDDMLAGKPTIEEVLPKFAEFCGDDFLVAHNAPFDVSFLSAEITKHETPAPGGVILCTCQIAKKVLPGLANYKLGTLVQHLKISSTEFHRAEQDAGYCGELFVRMMQKVFRAGEVPAMENLIGLSNNTALRFPKIDRKPKQLDLLSL